MASLKDVKSIKPNSGLIVEQTRWEPAESIEAKEGAGGQYGDKSCQMSRFQLLATSGDLSAQCLNIQVSRCNLGQSLPQIGVAKPYFEVQMRPVSHAPIRDA